MKIWLIFAIASPQIQNKLVLCKAYRNKTEKGDRSNSDFRVLRWNDGVVKAIALIKFLGECCAIANPQLTSVSFYLYIPLLSLSGYS
ncbi:hypothetical protein [Nostoc sp. UHCC 0251]|uniref:hypothetical protein n=1 Tax=Nostoc sp. UHCC 0251 TaxID=3110240 RepID=UPI002B1F9A3F|nr:hypothetical protein [Nostoc sp. UHCC 0251]MEA5622897.1 hypothetical protein [Nostoc sp. UHCC 0251]